MRAGMLAVTVSIGLSPLHLAAQTFRFSPSTDNPRGHELVAVFVSSSTCVGNRRPGFLESIDPMNHSLAERARGQGLPYVAVAVTTDWEPDSGYAYLRRLSKWNEVIVGRNWFNLGIAHYVWADTLTNPFVPEVILLERDTDMGTTRARIGNERVLARIVGADSILSWVRRGTPLP